MNKKLFYLMSLGFVVVLSCKKHDLEENFDKKLSASVNGFSANGISVNDGRLAFASKDAFDELMRKGQVDTLGVAIPNELAQVDRSHFTSYEQWRESIDNPPVMMRAASDRSGDDRSTENIIDVDTLIEDPLFAKVVNDKGEIQVENTIYKITRTGTFAVTRNSLSTLNSMLTETGYLKSPVNAQVIDDAEGLYKLADEIYLTDTYGNLRAPATGGRGGRNLVSLSSGGGRDGNSNTNPDDRNVVKGYQARYERYKGGGTSNIVAQNTPFSDMDFYEFNSKHTTAGKFLQNLFGDPHHKDFSEVPGTRLKVNFSSKNWLIFASVGVRAVVQKKTSALFVKYWKPADYKDEMRLGWTPIVLKMKGIDRITVPGKPGPQDPFSIAGKMLANKINIKLGTDDYLTVRVASILDANSAFPFLSPDQVRKLNNFSFDGLDFLNSQLDNQIMQMFALLKTKMGYPSGQPIALFHNDLLLIEPGEFKEGSGSNTVMYKNFDYSTVYVGYKINPDTKKSDFTYSPAKNSELVSGSVYAAARVGSKWVAIGVQKKQ